MNLFAQATNAPNSGASNAEDFQPLTRNPQTTGGGLQPGTGPQNTSGQDILSQENARIVVPVSDTAPETQQDTAAAGGGVNWFLVIAVAAVIVFAAEYFFRRRERNKLLPADGPVESPQTVETYPAEEPEAIEVPTGILEPQPADSEPKPPKASSTSQPTKKKKPAKKSKSKRKKSRK